MVVMHTGRSNLNSFDMLGTILTLTNQEKILGSTENKFSLKLYSVQHQLRKTKLLEHTYSGMRNNSGNIMKSLYK